MEDIFNLENIIIYLLVINLITFVAMFIDKKKAEKGAWRISESTLLTMALIGGSIGGIAGMYTFRHKTKKARFWLGMPVMLILQIVIIIYVCINIL